MRTSEEVPPPAAIPVRPQAPTGSEASAAGKAGAGAGAGTALVEIETAATVAARRIAAFVASEFHLGSPPTVLPLPLPTPRASTGTTSDAVAKSTSTAAAGLQQAEEAVPTLPRALSPVHELSALAPALGTSATGPSSGASPTAANQPAAATASAAVAAIDSNQSNPVAKQRSKVSCL
jgi:hypothetical protein